MSYKPSLPLIPFYNSNNETEPKTFKVKDDNPLVNSPKEYYKQILIFGKDENDTKIIRKLRDIQRDNTKYPKFHFLITQHNKILEGTPLERACNYSPESKNAIVIKLNTENEGRTERVLKWLLQDLKKKHEIDEKNIIYKQLLKQPQTAETYFYDIDTGELLLKNNDKINQVVAMKKDDYRTTMSAFGQYIAIMGMVDAIDEKKYEELSGIYLTELLFQNPIKKINITNKELNERAIWVYNECTGSIEQIHTKDVKFNIGEKIEINMKVADIYANTINNAVITDGSWEKVKKGPRIGKIINGKFKRTGIRLMRGEEPAGRDESRKLAKSYLKKGAKAFNEIEGACNARVSVINSIISPNKVGGVRAWFGSDSAKKYVDDINEQYSKAVFQFSFKSSDTFYHSFYRNN